MVEGQDKTSSSHLRNQSEILRQKKAQMEFPEALFKFD